MKWLDNTEQWNGTMGTSDWVVSIQTEIW